MNPVVMIVYNTTDSQLALTKSAVESVAAQDVGDMELWIINNGSTEPTRKWLDFLKRHYSRSQFVGGVRIEHLATNESPVEVANYMLCRTFAKRRHVLCVPNDVFLPSNLYREFLRWPVGIVTGSMTDVAPQAPRDSVAVSTCTPMAVPLIRKWCYDALVAKDGYFLDERFFHYASDCDLALRLAACGIRGVQLDTLYYHSGSASWRLADPETAKAITDQADRDRDYFERKWGFKVGSPSYGATAADINFKGIPKFGATA